MRVIKQHTALPYGLIALLFALWCNMSEAAGLDRLKQYFQNTQSMQADIHQTVFNKQGHKTQEVNGRMQLQKPNRFRWEYVKPYAQSIVGDGEKVWMLDADLNQVTVRSMGKVAGSSPAAMLSGGKEMEKIFTLQEGDNKNGLEWAIAIPKEAETGFDRVALGFRGDVLSEMELHDSFGNLTVIQFSNVQRNPKISADSFKFKAPANADVLVSD